MSDPAELLAIMEAQRAYFASDERIRDRAALWRDATPQECLAATAEACAAAAYLLGLKEPAELDRISARDELPEDTLMILVALQRRAG